MVESTRREARRIATAARIRDAAREEFTRQGYGPATIRRIAGRAGVDPSLVMQHFGSKERLFAAAMQLEAGSGEAALRHLADALDAELTELSAETRALLQASLTVPRATQSVRRYFDERAENLARSIDAEDAELRAALVVCAMLGLTVARHFLNLDVLARHPDHEIKRVALAWMTVALGDTRGASPGQ